MHRCLFIALLCLLCLCVSARRARKAQWGRRRRRWKKAVSNVAKTVADGAKRATEAAIKFAKDAFNNLLGCISDLKQCILSLINNVFKGLGLPSPVDNPEGNTYCLLPQGLCVTLPSPSLSQAPWKWGAKLHCVDSMMMVDYWMSFGQAFFDNVMGAIDWFLEKLCGLANAIMDFLMKAFQTVAKVFEPLLSPVVKLFKPLVDEISKVASAISGWFESVFAKLNLAALINIPIPSFPNLNFMKNGCIKIDAFGFGLDTCGIKEIYDSLKAVLCAIKNLDFDKFLKKIKETIKAVVQFGKTLPRCFKVTTKGLEAVFDAFPFVRTWEEQYCSGAFLATGLAAVAMLVGGAASALQNAFGWLMGSMKWLVGASSRAGRSNRSGGSRSDTVGIKSAIDIGKQEIKFDGEKGKRFARTNQFGEWYKGTSVKWFTDGSVKDEKRSGPKAFSKGIGLGWLHRLAFMLCFLFAFVLTLAYFGGLMVAFCVVKLVIVISQEAGVRTWVDGSFAVFYGVVVSSTLLSGAMQVLKDQSPYQGQFPKLGISWTGDCTGSAKYGSASRGKSNAVFLQAASLNPKLEMGWPAYAGKKWGLTVEIEFKPIWLVWLWKFESQEFFYVLGTQPMTDFQIEYDLVVFLKDTAKMVDSVPSEDDVLQALQDSKNKITLSEKVGSMTHDASSNISDTDYKESIAKSDSFVTKVKKYLTIYIFGSLELGKSVIKMFAGGPIRVLAEFLLRLSLAIMFFGWVFALCLTCWMYGGGETLADDALERINELTTAAPTEAELS